MKSGFLFFWLKIYCPGYKPFPHTKNLQQTTSNIFNSITKEHFLNKVEIILAKGEIAIYKSLKSNFPYYYKVLMIEYHGK